MHVHCHDVLELGLCRAGSGTYLVADKAFRFRAGDLLVIGPSEPHYSQSDRGTTSAWTYLHVDPVQVLAGVPDPERVQVTAPLAGTEFPNALSAATHPVLTQLVSELFAAVRTRAPGWRAEVRGLLLILLARLHRLPGRSVSEVEPSGAGRLLPALAVMSEHFVHPPGIPALARACGLGETTFRRHFAAAFGHGPKEHLVRLRLAHAAAALQRGEDVTSAASAAGFTALSAFHQQFRARYGVTPKAFNTAAQEAQSLGSSVHMPLG
jgi:AraC-like DNA-binding protein